MGFWRSVTFRLSGNYGTLVHIFEEEPEEIQWHKVRQLLSACGINLTSGRGDSTFLECNDVRTQFPTPRQEVQPPTIRKTADFLRQLDITPEQFSIFSTGRQRNGKGRA